MSDELNSQSSQPVTDASVGEGTNGAGQPSEPIASGMTDSQNRDYTIKTQQLAQERRQFEAERAAWEQGQGRYQQPHGQSTGGYFQNPNQSDPGYLGNIAPQPGLPIPAISNEEYAALVEQFGKEGADAQVRFFQKFTAPAQQLITHAIHKANEVEIKTLKSELDARGAQTYGEAWKQNGPAVLDLIGRTGLPMQQAWYAINGESIEQSARDKAYQAQQMKESSNVSQSNVQPANTHTGSFKGFDDAFEAAWAQGQR